MSQYGNADKFISIYNELDKYMESILIKKPELVNTKHDNRNSFVEKVKSLSKVNIIRDSYVPELISYANLRNVIVHEYKIGSSNVEKIIAQPLESEVEYFMKLAKAIMMPPKAYENIIIKKNSMYFASNTSKVNDIVHDMNENKYSYTPILQEDKLIGVFSHDTLFSFIAKNEGFILDDHLQLFELGEILHIDNHTSEKFEFIPRNCTVSEVENKFFRIKDTEKRLEVLFMTENGMPYEKILGLTTVWDLVQFHVNQII